MAKDSIKYLLLKNIVTSPALKPNGKPWRGAREKSDIFFQILINACFSFGNTIVDVNASTRASLQACWASGRHFIGTKREAKLYYAILVPLLPVQCLFSLIEGHHSMLDALKATTMANHSRPNSIASGGNYLSTQARLLKPKKKAKFA